MGTNTLKKNEILAEKPKILTQEQRQNYFENGFLALEKFVSDDWLARLNDVTKEFIDESRKLTASDSNFDLEPDHSADSPRLRRLMAPVEQHPVYREFGLEGPLVDLAQDLLGPNVKYHHSKLNFKWSDGGEEVKWHQDIPFWPHSNAAPLTIGLYLGDVDDEMGPLGVLPGSHLGPFYSHYNDNGEWTGALRDEDASALDFSKAEYLSGPAGSVTIHNSWMIHGSVPNNSPRSRNLLLHTYTAGDSIPLSTLVANYKHSDKFVRGSMPIKMELEHRAFEMPPDWSGGYTSIFDLQQKEFEG
jgi:ectoine hydroxylase-related dioxygenase (phytanoyl-CoA dioxygenase family)